MLILRISTRNAYILKIKLHDITIFPFYLASKVSIPLSNKYLLCTCYVSGTVAGSGEKKVKIILTLWTLYSSGVIDTS